MRGSLSATAHHPNERRRITRGSSWLPPGRYAWTASEGVAAMTSASSRRVGVVQGSRPPPLVRSVAPAPALLSTRTRQHLRRVRDRLRDRHLSAAQFTCISAQSLPSVPGGRTNNEKGAMMNIKSKLGRVAGVAAAVVAITGLGLTGTASASTARPAHPILAKGCVFQTVNGHYLTAVGGGGRITDVIHTDAVNIGSWEKFRLVSAEDGQHYGFKTLNHTYLTAVGGGGRITDVIHSDAIHLLAWEKFSLHYLGNGQYAIQTVNGHYLTAVGGGGRTTDTIHSDATQVLSWEEFRISCGH